MLQKGKSKKEKKPKKPRAKKAKAKAPKGQTIKQSVNINLGAKGKVVPTYTEYPVSIVRYINEGPTYKPPPPVEPPLDIKFTRPALNNEDLDFLTLTQPVGDFLKAGSETSSRRTSRSGSESGSVSSSSSSSSSEPDFKRISQKTPEVSRATEVSRMDFTRPPKKRIETLDKTSFNPPNQDSGTYEYKAWNDGGL